MPSRNVTTTSSKRTAKTSSYFVRSRANKSISGNGDLLQTWRQAKRRKSRNNKIDKAINNTICTLDDVQLSSTGSSSCRRGVLSVLAQTQACELQTELRNEIVRKDDSVSIIDAHVLTEPFILRPTINNTARVDSQRDILDDRRDGDDTTNIKDEALPQASQRPQSEEHQEEKHAQPHQQQQKRPKSPRKQPPKLSPYFPKPLPLIETSCLPFPPISAPTFGLIQEQLALSPFRLLIATIFLNRTRGPVAIPVLFRLFDLYPTIEDMASANHDDIVNIIHGLGFQNQRATKFIALARKWLDSPPERGKRYRKLNYPLKRDGMDIAPDEVVPDEDDDDDDEQEKRDRRRVAWEIAHLPGVGAYAIDSWRIFCRDRLRRYGLTIGGDDAYEPEWKRVLPQDKELRAYLSWKWLKEGWVWNCENGSRTKADSEMMKRAEKGGVAFEGGDGHLVVMDIHTSPGGSVHGLEGNGVIRKVGFSLDCS